jgi:hypothetical protein
VGQAVSALSRKARTILIVDQLDALSDLSDIKTERLAVLLALISRVASSGTPVVYSVREFDFQHRFADLDSTEVHLLPIAEQEIDAVLRTVGFDPGRASAKLKSLLSVPYWLSLFMKLTWDSQQALPATSQALLEQVWQQTISSSATSAAENEAAASALAQTISDREELWIPRAIVTRFDVAVQRLLALGILALDSTGMKLGFSHQNLVRIRAGSVVRTHRIIAILGTAVARDMDAVVTANGRDFLRNDDVGAL